jgi:hypothetical protein
MSKWVDEDELTITYGTLRKAMAESAEAERERIVALLEAEVWDSPELAVPYARHIIALIRGEQS